MNAMKLFDVDYREQKGFYKWIRHTPNSRNASN